MDKRTILSKPESGQTVNTLVLSDLHSFDCNSKGVISFLNLLSKCPGDKEVILLGDIIDCPYLHAKGDEFRFNIKNKNYEEYFLPLLDAEIIWYEELIETIGHYVSDYNKIHLAIGNHEERLTRKNFTKNMPICLEHNFKLDKRLQVDKRGMNLINYNDYYIMKANKSANLELTHGTHCGKTHMQRHFDDVHTSIIYGHTHQRSMQTYKGTPTCTVYNNPTLADMNPAYMGGRINNWTQGASMINRTRDHIFVNVLEMQDNKLLDIYGNEL